MTEGWLTLLGIVAIGVFYVLVPIFVGILRRYRAPRLVRCPETAARAEIEVDAFHAAITSIPGPPDLRVRACSLWPGREGCAQHCLAAGV